MRRLLDRIAYRGYPVSRCQVEGLAAFSMRTHMLRDDFISTQIRERGIREPFETKIVSCLLQPGQVFYDIGANIGWYSVVAALRVGAQGQVVSFEPGAENFELLQSNLRLNAVRNVRAFRLAVSNYDGEGALYKSPSNRGDHRTDAPDAARLSETIPVRSLRAVLREQPRPDMLKLDTQGSEAKILDGLLPGDCKQTLTLLVEYWPHGLARTGSTAKQLVDRLAAFGGRIFLIDHGSQELEETTPSRLLAMAENELHPRNMWFRDLLVLGPAAELPQSLRIR